MVTNRWQLKDSSSPCWTFESRCSSHLAWSPLVVNHNLECREWQQLLCCKNGVVFSPSRAPPATQVVSDVSAQWGVASFWRSHVSGSRCSRLSHGHPCPLRLYLMSPGLPCHVTGELATASCLCDNQAVVLRIKSESARNHHLL